ncbi:MAG TPA: hypothetical protein VNA13_03480 [Xanthomonadales bacterium]|nr:hypothetical protein [Xanthomonadales bacterium]
MAENNKKKGISPLTVGIAGTAAVAAGVAAVALSNKNNRKKAGKMLKDIRSTGEDLTKRAAAGLDKAMREHQKVRTTVSKLGAKVKNGSVKSKTKRKTATSSRSSKSTSDGQARSAL